MKFNCNKIITEEELDRRREERRHELEAIADRKVEEQWQKALPLRQWHRKFLWWPITIDNYDCRWLEFIEVRYPDARGPGMFVKYGDRYNRMAYKIHHYFSLEKMSIDWHTIKVMKGEPEYRIIREKD